MRKKTNYKLKLDTIKDIKASMRTIWGAIISFQKQIYTVDETTYSIRQLLEELVDVLDKIHEDSEKIKEMLKK